GTTSGHGIQFELSNNTDILNHRIVDYANAGINLRYGINGTTIQGNLIIHAQNGIVLATEAGQSNFQTLIGSFDGDDAKANRISGGETGILVNGGGNLWIQNNNIRDASKAGIDISNSGGAYNIINVNTINA